MQDILIRAGSFVAIIVLGWALRKAGFFAEDDFKVLAKIVINITLPAALISSFAGKQIDPSMLLFGLIGFCGGISYIFLGWLTNRSKGKEMQAFAMLNSAGYNIGNFALPFVQSFLGPVGIITTSLFDSGNAFISLGGAYGAACTVKDGSGFRLSFILKKLIRSVPFLCYTSLLILNLLNIRLPGPLVSCADIIAGANAFTVMLMIGVGFKLTGDFSQLGTMLKILSIRYGLAVIIALGCWFLLPFPVECRQALVILAFSPTASAAPAYTRQMEGDVGLSCAINSLSTAISIVIIVTLLVVML